MHFHFNLQRNTRFMQRIENICSSFSYFFLSFLAYPSLPSSSSIHHPSLLANIHVCSISETKPVETDGPRTSVLRINFTLASSKEYRHPRRNSDTEAVVAPRNIRASVSPTRERERERVTCMAIKWTTLTIHQFSISWNFNGSIYNIAASCASSTKGSRPS